MIQREIAGDEARSRDVEDAVEPDAGALHAEIQEHRVAVSLAARQRQLTAGREPARPGRVRFDIERAGDLFAGERAGLVRESQGFERQVCARGLERVAGACAAEIPRGPARDFEALWQGCPGLQDLRYRGHVQPCERRRRMPS